MKTKYFYIHGYGSGVNSDTLKRFKDAGYNITGLTYAVTNPEASVISMYETVVDYYEDYDWVVVIASSLGGWYAERLTDRVCAEFVLFNPSVYPDLSKYGESPEVCKLYDGFAIKNKSSIRRTVLLATDDEVIDYHIAEEAYKTTADVKYTSGGHRMTDKSFKDLCVILENNMNKV